MTPPDRPAPDLDADESLFFKLHFQAKAAHFFNGGRESQTARRAFAMFEKSYKETRQLVSTLRAQLAERDKRVAELERNAAQDAKHMERERQLSLNNLNASALLAADKRAAEARVAALEAANTRLREALGFCRELADHIAKAPIPVFRAHAIKARDCIDNALKGGADT